MSDYMIRATAANNQVRAFAATTKEMVQNLSKIMYNISRESAYAKLLLAYSQNEVEIKDFLNKNIF